MTETYQLWCVGCCFGGGRHTFTVFDDVAEAEWYLADQLTQPGVLKARLWDM